MEPEIHFRGDSNPLLVPNLSQMHPVRIFPPYFSKIQSNIILPSTPSSFKWSLPSRFSIPLAIYYTSLYINSRDKSPSWEANSHSASQEIPRLLWRPQIHYRVHNGPPLVFILSQMHPAALDIFQRTLLATGDSTLVVLWQSVAGTLRPRGKSRNDLCKRNIDAISVLLFKYARIFFKNNQVWLKFLVISTPSPLSPKY